MHEVHHCIGCACSDVGDIGVSGGYYIEVCNVLLPNIL